MINQLLTEKDILDYLMTSDFNEGLTQEESKFLLLRYRNYYRQMYAKYESARNVSEEISRNLERTKIDLSTTKSDLDEIKIDLENEKNRRLTWKERFYGKKI